MVSDVIPWRSMIAPGVLLQKYRHGLQRSYAVRGPDVMGESPEVQGALMLRANEVLKRLGGRWMLQSEAQRQRVTTLPEVRVALAGADACSIRNAGAVCWRTRAAGRRATT